jgi:hypothetical protein
VDAGARITAVIAFGLCATLLAVHFGLLIAKRFPGQPADQPAARTSALSTISMLFASCIITGTVAAGWTVSHPEATLSFGGPAVLGSLILSLYFRARARRRSNRGRRSRYDVA